MRPIDRAIECITELEAKLADALWQAQEAVGWAERADAACVAMEAENARLQEVVKAFLRAPHVGSDGPGSSTIVIQEFHLREARAPVKKEQNVTEKIDYQSAGIPFPK